MAFLILLLLLLLLWTFFTKTLCFATRDRNNNVKRSQGNNSAAQDKSTEIKTAHDVKKEQISQPINHEGISKDVPVTEFQGPSLRDNSSYITNRPVDSATNGVYSGYNTEHDFNRPIQPPTRVSRARKNKKDNIFTIKHLHLFIS